MKLVHNARDALRWHSVRASLLGAILSAAATALALASSVGSLAGVIPVWALCALFCLIFIAALVGRLLLQRPRPRRPKWPKRDDDWDEYGA